MTSEDAEQPDPLDDEAANIAALEHEVQLLEEIRAGLASQPGSVVMVEATTGLIEQRRAELERAST